MKRCSKCKIEKELDDFYKKKSSTLGIDSRCKNCCLEEKKLYHERKMKDPDWIEKQRQRGVEKYHRLYRTALNPVVRNMKHDKKYFDRFPEKKAAGWPAQSVELKISTNHRHHWSYNPEHYKDVIEMSRVEHVKAHRYIFYDQERYMYRRCDNMQLLDTRELHVEYLQSLNVKMEL